MGRHSAARHTHSAVFVGRVGSLALALGIGAAVAGGAGIANAEGGDDGHASASAPKPDSGAAAEAKTPKPASTKTKPAAPSLSGVIAGISKQLAAAVHPVGPAKPASSTGTSNDPATKDPATKDSASNDPASKSTRSKPRTQTPSDDAPASEKTATPFTRKLANEAAAAIRGDVKPLRSVATPTADVTPAQAPAPVPSTTTVFNVAAASTPVAPVKPRQALANPIATVVSGLLSAVGLSPTASSTGNSPAAPMPLVMGVLQLIRREVDHLTLNLSSPSAQYTSALANADPSVATTVPTPGDQTATAYGAIGKWMLQPGGQISNYGGQPYGGKTLLEPVNVIIVDPTSTSSTQAAWKLNSAMFWSGFPAQPIHSTGFTGKIDNVTYGQQPQGLLDGYSDNLFIFPNDHGRIFGPDPVQTSTGYVWSGAFSTEQLGFYGFLPTHTYVSSNMARNALAMRLIASGQATYGGIVPLNNAYDTDTTTTGDHDGYAVVLILK